MRNITNWVLLAWATQCPHRPVLLLSSVLLDIKCSAQLSSENHVFCVSNKAQGVALQTSAATLLRHTDRPEMWLAASPTVNTKSCWRCLPSFRPAAPFTASTPPCRFPVTMSRNRFSDSCARHTRPLLPAVRCSPACRLWHCHCLPTSRRACSALRILALCPATPTPQDCTTATVSSGRRMPCDVGFALSNALSHVNM